MGLQLKSVLLLASVVLGVSLSGGWFYYASFRAWLGERDRQEAGRIGRSLELAARRDLQEGRTAELRTLAFDFLGRSNVCLAAILDEKGKVVARASRDAYGRRWEGLLSLPISVGQTKSVDDTVLTHAQPIVAVGPRGRSGDRVIGAGRVVLDTTETARRLARVQRRMSLIAAGIIVCAIPIAYLLAWRVVVQPIRLLAAVARKLGRGDMHVRARMKRADEIGDLAAAFDSMAGEVAESRNKLVEANENLERRVADRTCDLESSNRRLEEAIAEKEDFLRAVSHDLNAPLRNIAGIATMTSMKWRDKIPSEVAAKLQRIQTNVDAGTSMISELLELSHIRTRPQHRQDVDFGDLADAVARTFEFDLKSKSISLEIQDPMPTLHVEKPRMRQVFQNLIDNAIKYMDRPTGGRIEIGCQEVDRGHQFHVRDNGPGIAADQQRHIFSVFRRVANATIAGIEGRGVGLAVVRTVVGNYNGRAWVESEPGQGATFYFTLETGPDPAEGDDPPAPGDRA